MAVKASGFQLGLNRPPACTTALGPAYSVTNARPSACSSSTASVTTAL